MTTGIQSNRGTGAAADALAAYHRARMADWSKPQYEYDKRFVRLTLMVDKGPEGVVPEAGRKPSDNLAQLLEEIDEQAAVLLGRPGSGKTTLLGRRQWEHARDELATPTGQLSYFAWLNSYRATKTDDPQPYEWLERDWKLLYPTLPRFETLFQDGRLLLLLDGLNEMPHQDEEDYGERVGRWQTFLRTATQLGNRAVFSCRADNYVPTLNSVVVPVRQIDVQPLSSLQIADFLDHYLPEHGAAVYDVLAADTRQLELYSNPFFLKLLVDWVQDRHGRLPEGQAELLTGFVRRALRRELGTPSALGGRLFSNQQLLSRDDRQQIDQRAWEKPYDLPAEGLLIRQLETLAFRMQDDRKSGEQAQVSLPEQQARQLLEPALAEEVLAAGIQLNVLDKDLKKREIKFFHQLIQEYFAARVLAQTPDARRVQVAWDVREVTPALAEELATLPVGQPLPLLAATGWEETTVLAAAMTADRKTFVDLLTFFNLPLAGRCAAVAEVRPHLAAAFIERLQKELLERIGDAGADLRGRIAAAEALGELGDPRFERRSGPHGDYLLPRLLASIPGGTYTIGDDEGQYDDEKPAHPVAVAAFEMGVFPVTNAEYRLFIEADGYEDEQWWDIEAARAWQKGEGSAEGQKAWYRDLVEQLRSLTEEAIRELPNFTPDQIELLLWLKGATPEALEQQLEMWYPSGVVHKQPNFWEDSRFNHQARPVVGVSWYEARAYCAWLSAQTGEAFGLPTEAEWEAAARGYAARGQVNRSYGYDGAFDTAKCNTFETHIRATTPVGVFPDGKTPEGVYDLSGNVWEWTSTVYQDYPYDEKDGREAPDDALARRVVRGGSWSGDRQDARAVSRLPPRPDGP